MVQNSKVKPNQSFLDVIVNVCGTLETGMMMSLDNAWPISYMPPVDTSVNVGDYELDDLTALKYLQQNNIVIGTKGAPPAASVLITEDTEQTIIGEDGADIFAQEE